MISVSMPLLLRVRIWVAVVVAAACGAMIDGCAPRVYYPPPLPPPSSAPSTAKPQTAPAPPAPPPQETAKRTLPQESSIREQDLRSKRATTPRGSDVTPPQTPAETKNLPDRLPPLPDDSSLLAKITAGTDARRAASLRLTEEGRKLLDSGEAAKALNRLEKTIVIDATNPYGYFYLAKAQYRLGHYKESLNFLDVAESRFSSGDRFWLAELYALRGENYRALGMLEQAEGNYNQALRLNSGNRTAAEAMIRLQGENQAAPR